VSAALARGQLPVDELARVEKAHDVRTLRVCARCGQLGNNHSMIGRGDEWLHGRCFVALYGRAELCRLPKPTTDRLTLGDLGTAVMRYLLSHREQHR
jgi:hypothetical protein